MERRAGEASKVTVPENVLLIEPAKPARERGSTMIKDLGFMPCLAADAFEAHALVDSSSVVIVSHPQAAEVYPRLKAASIPFVAAFAPKTKRASSLAAELGADAYLIKPYRIDAIGLALYAAQGARLLRQRALRAELALADVTGVRREQERSGLLHIDLFKTLLPLEIRRARRHGYPIAICVVSLDPLPDARHVSPEVAAACEPFLRGAVRDVDLAVRYGDGRFLVFLPHTDGRGADAVGRRICSEIRNCHFKSGGVQLTVTASVGIATPRPGKVPSFARLIRDAHAAVKAAQLKGGDRAIVR
jgi:diguanylate cyclase (GGDEF)-like protein